MSYLEPPVKFPLLITLLQLSERGPSRIHFDSWSDFSQNRSMSYRPCGSVSFTECAERSSARVTDSTQQSYRKQELILHRSLTCSLSITFNFASRSIDDTAPIDRVARYVP